LTNGRISDYPGYSRTILGRCRLMPDPPITNEAVDQTYKYDIFDPYGEIPKWCPLEDVIE
jgi:hypothetical protein